MEGEVCHLGKLKVSAPVLACAPMVGQCDLPFRELCRKYGATLVYTEMLRAEELVEERYWRDAFGEASSKLHDSGPLLVQTCTRSPEAFGEAARKLRSRFGAERVGIDLNLGCPQLRAKDGGYGAYLAEEWDLCEAIVRAGREAGPDLAVTVKLRLQKTARETIEFARRLVAAGASAVALHARPRGRTDARRDGAAQLDVVRDLAAALDVPVFSNGNVRSAADVVRNLDYTRASGVLVAEELLRYPALYADVRHILLTRSPGDPFSDKCGDASKAPSARRRIELVGEYLDVCAALDPVIRRKDGSERVNNGNLVRAPTAADDPTARYSNWWPNIDSIRLHVRHMVPDSRSNDIFSRNIFRKATCPAHLDAYLRRRLSLPPPPPGLLPGCDHNLLSLDARGKPLSRPPVDDLASTTFWLAVHDDQ